MTIEATSATEFGTLLRHFRDRARLTQNELAGLSAVSPRTIRNLEAGRAMSPRADTVRLLADGLRLSAESQARLSLAAGQSPVGAALDAAQGHLPAWDAALDRDPYGREQDLRSVLACVHADGSCLVSLSGFGGVGKSRLAAALVREAEHTLHTRWLWLQPSEAEGAAARSPVEAAFEQWYRDLAGGQSDAADTLARLIGDQQYLIVVDGAHPATDSLESNLRELIRRCPRLTVIETTRRPLLLEGRHLVPLTPLRLPAEHSRVDATLVGHPAMQVLLPLVRATQPDFRESEENLRYLLQLCHSLDGLPRALESAATWFAFCPPAMVAEAARENPRPLAAPGQDDAAADWLSEAVDDALRDLPDSQRCLLSELAGRTAPWTIEDLTEGSGPPCGEIVESLKNLLALGVIRPSDDSDARTYTVLNLLRPALT